MLILERSGCILTAGDATVYIHRMPAAAGLSSATAPSSKPASSCGSRGFTARPRSSGANARPARSAAATAATAASPAEASTAPPAAKEQPPAAAAAPENAGASLQLRRSVSITPSPNRRAALADLPRQQDELAALQAEWAASQQARASKLDEVRWQGM